MTSYVRSSSEKTYHIGVLFFPSGVQMFDACSIDFFAMASKEYLTVIKMPSDVIDVSVDMKIHIVAQSEPGTITPLTGGFGLGVTDSLESCPPLDILLLPGPPVGYVITPEEGSFIRKCANNPDATAVITICSGIFPAVQAGLLANQSATAPRGLLPMLRHMAKETEWLEKRWHMVPAHDGRKTEIWTAGGILNGLDCVATFLKHWFASLGKGREKVIDIVLEMADWEIREQEYKSGMSADLTKLMSGMMASDR